MPIDETMWDRMGRNVCRARPWRSATVPTTEDADSRVIVSLIRWLSPLGPEARERAVDVAARGFLDAHCESHVAT